MRCVPCSVDEERRVSVAKHSSSHRAGLVLTRDLSMFAACINYLFCFWRLHHERLHVFCFKRGRIMNNTALFSNLQACTRRMVKATPAVGCNTNPEFGTLCRWITSQKRGETHAHTHTHTSLAQISNRTHCCVCYLYYCVLIIEEESFESDTEAQTHDDTACLSHGRAMATSTSN